MYLYNVTVNIDESVHDDWLKWMKEEHIPDMLATGKFKKALMSKVMVQEETGGTTYAVQYYADSKAQLNEYYTHFAEKMRNEAEKRFKGKFVAFRTELDVEGEFTTD